jgi:thiamine biosynthesis lipoprotein
LNGGVIVAEFTAAGQTPPGVAAVYPPIPACKPAVAVLLLIAAILEACGAAPAQPPPPAPAGPVLDPEILQEAAALNTWQRLSFPSMSTTYELILPAAATAEVAATAAIQSAFAAIAEVERQANEWRADSPLAQLNRQAGGEFLQIPQDLWALLQMSRSLAAQTQGAFDPTWAALWGLWDFRPGAVPRLPLPAEIQARLSKISWQDIQLRESDFGARLAKPGMVLGLGAIAKGWALDRAAAELRKAGIANFLLSAGGQVLAAGTQGGKAWTVGLRHPRLGPGEVWAHFPLQDGESLSTSGDYERFWILDGVRYHHILDPRTGYPAGHGQSHWPYAVAVLARGAAQADALSTAALVLGPQAEAAIGPHCLGIFAYGPAGPRLWGPRAEALQNMTPPYVKSAPGIGN